MPQFRNTDNGRVLEVDDASAFIYDRACNFVRVDHEDASGMVNLDKMKLDELKAFAAEQNVELGDAITKAEIREVLVSALEPVEQD